MKPEPVKAGESSTVYRGERRLGQPMENPVFYQVRVKAGGVTKVVEYYPEGSQNNVIVQHGGVVPVLLCDKQGNRGHVLNNGGSLPLLELGADAKIYATTMGSDGSLFVIVW